MPTRRAVLILALGSPWIHAGESGAGSRARNVPVDAGGTAGAVSNSPAGVYGHKIVSWSRLESSSLGANLDNTDLPPALDGTQHAVRLRRSAARAMADALTDGGLAYRPRNPQAGCSLGIWVRNPQARTLNFELRASNASGSGYVKWNCAVDPHPGWIYLTMSPTQQVSVGWNSATDTIARVRVAQVDTMAEGPWRDGEYLAFGNVYADVTTRPLFCITFDDGFDSQRHPSSTGLRGGQQIVESHGFKGSLFLVPSWLGTSGRYGYGRRPNTFLSAADVKAMVAAGWSVGSHTNTHPSNGENAGLRLLGPFGYFLSNPVDHLPARYVAAWELGPAYRRRAVAATASDDVVRFENPHRFLPNMPIVFVDVAPTGFALGVPYYCQSIPSPTSATFATDQGKLQQRVAVGADWTGLANYRYPGAANDDSAIYADIMAGIAGVAALGVRTGAKFFALPQGSADEYVRSACERAGVTWVRGASLHAHTIPVGRPTGGGLSNVVNQPGGWLAQPDCVQTDAAVSPSLTDIRRYVDETVVQGACGCSYHHDVIGGSVANLENLCVYLRAKVDAGVLDVVTLDEMAKALKF